VLTLEQAILLSKTKFWERYTALEVVQFQLFEDRLCLPMDIYFKCLQVVFDRPFSSEDLEDVDLLRYEFSQRFFLAVIHSYPHPGSQR
jgi:hypothetical protein